MLYFLYVLGNFVANTLPIKSGYILADFSGVVYYWFARKDRKIVAENLKVVLSQSGDCRELDRLIPMVFANFGRYLLEFFRSPKIDQAFIRENIKFEGRQHLEEALKLGKGVILVGAHIGNWEMGAMTLAMLGYRMRIVAWSHKDKRINNFFLQRRKDKGVEVISLGWAIRKVFSSLKENALVAILGDIDYADPDTGIRVKFFGRETILPQGPAVFSLRTGAPIVVSTFLRETPGKFKLVMQPPMIYQSSGNQDEDVAKFTQNLAKAMETFIAQYPDQWFMLRPRWEPTLEEKGR